MMGDIQNGTEVWFSDGGNTAYAVIKKRKDNWGNVTGLQVVSEDGEEFDVVEHNGETCLTNGAVDVPTPVGQIATDGEADWFSYAVGGYNID